MQNLLLVQSVNENDFIDAFFNMNRNDNFTLTGKKELFAYLETLAEDMGKPIELDVIALCCDFNELTTDEVIREYGIEIDFNDYGEPDADETAEIKNEVVREYLNENTSVAAEYEIDNEMNFLFQCF